MAIRDLVTVRGGGTPRKSVPDYFGGDVPWVTPKDMKRWLIDSSEISLTESGVTSSPAKLVPAGAVLVVVRSGVLKHTLPVALATRNVTVNQDMKALIPTAEVHGAYLARLLKARQPEILGWVRATTADNFPIDKLLDMRVTLPSLSEQHHITAILDQADLLRAKRRDSLAVLENAAHATFRSMFGEAPTDVLPLGELIQHQAIGLDRRASEQGPERRFEYVKMDAITARGRLDLSSLSRVDATPEEVAKYSVEDGDLLLNTRNSRELVGKNAIYRGTPRLYNNNLMRIRFDDRVTAEYIHQYLWTPEGRRQLEARKAGTTSVFAMYAKSLTTLEIPVPTIELQRAFTRSIRASDAAHLALEDSRTHLDQLFASLQSSAFPGGLTDSAL